MLPICRPTITSLYLLTVLTIVINLSALPIEAFNPQGPHQVHLPRRRKQTSMLQATSEKIVNFEDIYQIKLNLEIPSDIEIVATENNAISVTIEKQTQATNTESDTLMREYLDNISITETRSDGTLQLGIQLPTDDTPDAKPNPLANMPDLQTTVNDQLQLKWTINTPQMSRLIYKTKQVIYA